MDLVPADETRVKLLMRYSQLMVTIAHQSQTPRGVTKRSQEAERKLVKALLNFLVMHGYVSDELIDEVINATR